MLSALAEGFRVGMLVARQGERRIIAGDFGTPPIRTGTLAVYLEALALRGVAGNE